MVGDIRIPKLGLRLTRCGKAGGLTIEEKANFIQEETWHLQGCKGSTATTPAKEADRGEFIHCWKNPRNANCTLLSVFFRRSFHTEPVCFPGPHAGQKSLLLPLIAAIPRLQGSDNVRLIEKDRTCHTFCEVTLHSESWPTPSLSRSTESTAFSKSRLGLDLP